MVINKKVIRTMMQNKAQYIGSILLITISCLLFTMFNQLNINLDQIISSFEQNYAQEDANFVPDKKLSHLPNLESKFDLMIEEGGSFDYAVSKDQTLRVFAENKKVNRYALIEGNPLSENGILIDPAYAKANAIQVGDRLNLYGKTFTVNGFMSLPHYIYPLKSEGDLLSDPNRFGIAVINRHDFDKLDKGSRFYSIKARGDQADIENKIRAFKDYLADQHIAIVKWMDIDNNLRVTYVDAKLDSMKELSSSMPVAILLLTCVLTGVILWRMLKTEWVIVGSLYALGYRKREIMRHYLMYPLTIGVTGGILGTVLGALTLKPMLAFFLAFFNMPMDSTRFDAGYVAISILLPVVFLGISGYFVINKALRYTPVQLMRGGQEKRKVGLIERKIKLNKLKFTTKFKIREQLRSIPRTLFLLFGVVLATMLLLLGFTMKSSIDFMLKDSFDSVYKYKHQYVFNSLQHGQPTNGEAFSEIPVSLKSDDKKSFTIYGVHPDTQYISFKDDKGKKVRFNQVVMTKPLADRLNVKAHDTITIVNMLDSRTTRITVDQVVDSYVGGYLYLPLSQLNQLLGYPADSYMGLWSDKPLSLPEHMLLSSTTVDDVKKAFDSMLEPLQASIGTIAFMSFIIGLIVIYVATSLIIEENKDNISLMKILGYRKKDVYSLILNSSSFIIVIGYLLGVPLLFLWLDALFASVIQDINFALPLKIDYLYIIIGFVIITLTYNLAKALSRKKINQISMAEALKSRAE